MSESTLPFLGRLTVHVKIEQKIPQPALHEQGTSVYNMHAGFTSPLNMQDTCTAMTLGLTGLSLYVHKI